MNFTSVAHLHIYVNAWVKKKRSFFSCSLSRLSRKNSNLAYKSNFNLKSEIGLGYVRIFFRMLDDNNIRTVFINGIYN